MAAAYLTHWDQDKMTAISQTFSDAFLQWKIENGCISIDISLNFVPKGQINNISALVQMMSWRRPDDKPLSEPMVVCLPPHTCVILPQWVNVSFHRLVTFCMLFIDNWYVKWYSTSWCQDQNVPVQTRVNTGTPMVWTYMYYNYYR